MALGCSVLFSFHCMHTALGPAPTNDLPQSPEACWKGLPGTGSLLVPSFAQRAIRVSWHVSNVTQSWTSAGQVSGGGGSDKCALLTNVNGFFRRLIGGSCARPSQTCSPVLPLGGVRNCGVGQSDVCKRSRHSDRPGPWGTGLIWLMSVRD